MKSCSILKLKCSIRAFLVRGEAAGVPRNAAGSVSPVLPVAVTVLGFLLHHSHASHCSGMNSSAPRWSKVCNFTTPGFSFSAAPYDSALWFTHALSCVCQKGSQSQGAVCEINPPLLWDCSAWWNKSDVAVLAELQPHRALLPYFFKALMFIHPFFSCIYFWKVIV